MKEQHESQTSLTDQIELPWMITLAYFLIFWGPFSIKIAFFFVFSSNSYPDAVNISQLFNDHKTQINYIYEHRYPQYFTDNHKMNLLLFYMQILPDSGKISYFYLNFRWLQLVCTSLTVRNWTLFACNLKIYVYLRNMYINCRPNKTGFNK